nr:MAG TPA: hypothetical protein [Caudoviricetes sp.]
MSKLYKDYKDYRRLCRSLRIRKPFNLFQYWRHLYLR